MILDSLKNAGLYLSLNPLFKQAFDFVENNDISAFEPGKTIIDSDKLFISVMEIDGKTPETAKLETHNKYIDIQIVLEGNETMGWLDIDNCKTAVDIYNPEKDITFFKEKPSTYFTLRPGDFVIFFPEDGHAPAIGNGHIKKAVIKVLV
jgi:biofilm protein TabA